MPSSRDNLSTWRLTFVVAASRSTARVSWRNAKRSWFRSALMLCSACSSSGGSSKSLSEGSWAALTAPHNSWPKTTMTFTFKWWTAYCKEAWVEVSKALPATRTTKRSPKPWSKIISVGTRESEQPKIATEGNCFVIRVRRWKALASGRVAAPVQNLAFPRCKSCNTSRGVRAKARCCAPSAWSRASSMVKPSQAQARSTSEGPWEGRLPVASEARRSFMLGRSSTAGAATRSSADGAFVRAAKRASWRLHEVPMATPDNAHAPNAKPPASAMSPGADGPSLL
mmetsp:Transcript_16696/g.48467  ORF Transcript_16696/g.48467 Transcript_16696/m.48467 type:complete len:283 (-) Transcript_16696:6-854(-)